MMFVIKVIVVAVIFNAVLIFILKKVLFTSTQGAVYRLNKDTEKVRQQQSELNEKIKQANEELVKRRQEADALVSKMKEQADEEAKKEREKILNRARAEAEGVIEKAQQTKDDIRRELEKEMELKAVDFTVLILNEILSERSMAALNQSLFDEFLSDLKSLDMEMIGDEVTSAEVVTAQKFDEKLISQLKSVLKEKLGRDVEVKATEDKEIIGGIILRFGSLRVDLSFKTIIPETGSAVKEKIEKGILQPS